MLVWLSKVIRGRRVHRVGDKVRVRTPDELAGLQLAHAGDIGVVTEVEQSFGWEYYKVKFSNNPHDWNGYYNTWLERANA